MKKLLEIQTRLKAGKDQKNTFGGFNYRSAEGIYEAVKPLLREFNCTLVLSDHIENVGAYNYVISTATIKDLETGESVSASAAAREAASKKGMDDSQVTGSCESYARKYAMCGLFLIDDAKNDPDSDHQTRRRQKAEEDVPVISMADAKKITALLKHTGADITAFLNYYGVESVEMMNYEQYRDAVFRLDKKGAKA